MKMLRSLFQPNGPEPSYPKLPRVDDVGRTSAPGIFVVGDAAGTPLLKLGLNAGARCADAIADDLEEGRSDDTVDIAVIGAGAAGLACAARAQARGLSVVVLEGQELAQTVVAMTKGKRIFDEPLSTKNESDLWLGETTREELLDRWRAFVRERAIDVRAGAKVLDVKTSNGAFELVTDRPLPPSLVAATATRRTLPPAVPVRARRVVVAVGKSGSPRKAGVPGEAEHAHKIKHALADAELVKNQRVLVYGGGDVACECALALSAPHLGNTVTLATVDAALTFPKKRNRDAVHDAAREGRIALHLATKLARVGANDVELHAAGTEARPTQVGNDVVFEMIGADAPLPFFRKLGLAIEGEWTFSKYLVAAAVFLAVYSLYALKKFPDQPYAWPFTSFIDAASFARVVGATFDVAFAPFRWLFTDVALADVKRTLWFQQGYLYSLLYTLVMIGFGGQALLRWKRIAKRPSYQKWRYASLIAFQIVFFLLANVIAVQGLSIQHSWRAWGLYQPWPLFFHTFNWWTSSDPAVVKWGFIGAGLLGTFVAIPLLSWKHGKRFCTWVCGCGGLAETLGDRWRHLAPKGKRSRAWEVQGLAVLVAVAVVTLVTVGMYNTRADNAWALAYAYVVDFWLVAVVPITLYPFFGGKIWCRYWCPLAAWNQVLAALYGRLGIKSNDQCISCGQCSKQCQVGVDVMQFARAQERFDNKNSSCIHCGICIDVCPVDVLSFDTAKSARASSKSLPIVNG
jgi:NosR/NirI family nitrous oxide reductase transcriptional regulator